MKKLTLLIIGLAYSSCVLSAEWKFTGLSPVVASFIDPSSIKKTSNNTRIVWEEFVFTNESMQNNTKSSVFKSEYFCKEGSSITLAVVNYSPTGNVINSNYLKGANEDIVPGSFGENTLDFVCSGKTPQSYVSVPDNPVDAANRVFSLRAQQQASQPEQYTPPPQ